MALSMPSKLNQQLRLRNSESKFKLFLELNLLVRDFYTELKIQKMNNYLEILSKKRIKRFISQKDQIFFLLIQLSQILTRNHKPSKILFQQLWLAPKVVVKLGSLFLWVPKDKELILNCLKALTIYLEVYLGLQELVKMVEINQIILQIFRI